MVDRILFEIQWFYHHPWRFICLVLFFLLSLYVAFKIEQVGKKINDYEKIIDKEEKNQRKKQNGKMDKK